MNCARCDSYSMTPTCSTCGYRNPTGEEFRDLEYQRMQADSFEPGGAEHLGILAGGTLVLAFRVGVFLAFCAIVVLIGSFLLS